MPMNEYGEIIRNSSPPPSLSPRNDRNNNDNNGGGSSIIAIVIGIVILIIIIWFIANAADQKTNDDYSANSPDNNLEYSQNVDSSVGDGENIVSSEYILPNSDSEYISYSDLDGLTQEQVMLARNEIYARRGRKFDTDSIREYFESKSWYKPTYAPDDFSDTVFNDYEKENINTIVNYETEKGWR